MLEVCVSVPVPSTRPTPRRWRREPGAPHRGHARGGEERGAEDDRPHLPAGDHVHGQRGGQEGDADVEDPVGQEAERGVEPAAEAEALAELLAIMPARLSLIDWNPVPGLPYRPPTPEERDRFHDRLACKDLLLHIMDLERLLRTWCPLG